MRRGAREMRTGLCRTQYHVSKSKGCREENASGVRYGRTPCRSWHPQGGSHLQGLRLPSLSCVRSGTLPLSRHTVGWDQGKRAHGSSLFWAWGKMSGAKRSEQRPWLLAAPLLQRRGGGGGRKSFPNLLPFYYLM